MEDNYIPDIPSDLVLLLSGVSCVGKTTAAYNLLKRMPSFKVVTQIDIIRTAIRAIIKEIKDSDEGILIEDWSKYEVLFNASSTVSFTALKKQAKLLVSAIREIAQRQQMRKIPTIIEGIGIVPSLYFHRNAPIRGFQANIIFINLYISNVTDHLLRRTKRCLERGNAYDIHQIRQKLSQNRRYKNEKLHYETLALSKRFNNVYSIDVSDMDEIAVVDKIITIINQVLLKKI